MKYYKNTKTGQHCVQACLKTLLYHLDLPVMTFRELDKITGHDSQKWTWMSRAILWLTTLGMTVRHVENLSYCDFAKDGRKYLRKIWDKDTYMIQDAMSDLGAEQKDAVRLLKNRMITLKNSRLTIKEVADLYRAGYFVILSVNPNVLAGKKGYGSHVVVISGVNKTHIRICDPDSGQVWHSNALLEKAISVKNKPDFSATLVKLR